MMLPISVCYTLLSVIILVLLNTSTKAFSPLDPLTPDEIKQTSDIIKIKYPNKNWAFMGILLNDPPKSELYQLLVEENNGIPLQLPNTLDRKLFAVLYEFGTGSLHEAVVNLNTKDVERFKTVVSGTKPNYRTEFFPKWTSIVMNDTRVQKRVTDLGYELGSVVTYCTAYFSIADPDKYLCNFLFFAREFYNDNYYAHVLDFNLVFDINEEEIITIDDCPIHDQFKVRNKNKGVTVSRLSSNYDAKLPGFQLGNLREDVKPLKVTFSEGPSYTVKGNEVSWQKFKFRINFNYREGLVLYDIKYKDGKKIRPLFYRLSVSELAVTYADPRPIYNKKQFFDESSYGLGNPPNSLVDGEDCIGSTTFFNATINKPDGSYHKILNAACLSEMDDGILWKHTNEFSGKRNIARSRKLTLTSIVTLDNYEYVFLWHFYQDASIEFEVKTTGIILTQLLAKGAKPFGFGTTVFPQVNAPYHQHIFVVRIDPMVDGRKNTVSTIDVVPVDDATGSPTNPYGNGFTIKETVLKKVGQARTNVAPKMARVWKIGNDAQIHPYTKKSKGYKLIPMNTDSLMLKEDSPFRKLIRFSEYSVWVSPYKDYNHFISGFYVGQNSLPEWVDQNEDVNVENEDVVIWHTFTHTHIPRVEDFPVMPQEHIGFLLKPYNFFNGNPGLDVP